MQNFTTSENWSDKFSGFSLRDHSFGPVLQSDTDVFIFLGVPV